MKITLLAVPLLLLAGCSPSTLIGELDAGPDGGPDAGSPSDAGHVCLLQYNSAALNLSDGGQTSSSQCCYFSDGANQCDLAATCGPAAGGQCCLIYSTPADPVNSACCYYEHNVNPPSDPTCGPLLDGGR